MTNLEREKRQLLDKIEWKNINAELLEALKVLVATTHNYGGWLDRDSPMRIHDEIEVSLRKALEAIAKAEGNACNNPSRD